uniref:Uncharacterized protein n=1 Tax=Pipistrellus kuhlii TaxID=59472 RepID=A0A7J7X0K8_PIPKU|nr:hypothetical protein mPipKuh1_010811 [Pipistrellus kuhlii]
MVSPGLRLLRWALAVFCLWGAGGRVNGKAGTWVIFPPLPVPALAQLQCPHTRRSQTQMQKERRLPNWRNVNSSSLARAAASTRIHFISRPAGDGTRATFHSTHGGARHLHLCPKLESPHPSAGRAIAGNGPGTLPTTPEKELASGNSSVPATEPLKLLPDPELPLLCLLNVCFGVISYFCFNYCIC